MKKDFLKFTLFYTAGIVAVFCAMWVLLAQALPEAKLNVISALSTTFGINLPDNIFVSADGTRAMAVVLTVTLLSIGLIVLNVFFGAIITAIFIRPRIQIATSKRGVLSTRWNAGTPHVLVRMASFHRHDLVDVRINAVLTVRETRDDGEHVMSHFPIPAAYFTPPHVLVLRRRMPWTIAVAADTRLSNSMSKDYPFAPGLPFTQSVTQGKRCAYVERTLEILIQGLDTKSYATFVLHREVPVDAQDGDNYILKLHRGAFMPLPLQIDSADMLERYDA
jgi:hypothetical protein